MSWREKLGLPESGDRSDESTPSVSSVTGFPYQPNQNSPQESSHRKPINPKIASALEAGITRAGWKAAALNKLFKDQGVTGQPWPDHCGDCEAWLIHG